MNSPRLLEQVKNVRNRYYKFLKYFRIVLFQKWKNVLPVDNRVYPLSLIELTFYLKKLFAEWFPANLKDYP
jgi:hypothetical protein